LDGERLPTGQARVAGAGTADAGGRDARRVSLSPARVRTPTPGRAGSTRGTRCESPWR
jgi:hypothetical protein